MVKNTKSRKVVSRVATALRRAAQSAANSRSALGGFYRRLRARLGPAKAITATAHKLARIFYRMWKYRERYHPLSLDHYETQYRDAVYAAIVRLAEQHKLIALRRGAAPWPLARLSRCDLAVHRPYCAATWP